MGFTSKHMTYFKNESQTGKTVDCMVFSKKMTRGVSRWNYLLAQRSFRKIQTRFPKHSQGKSCNYRDVTSNNKLLLTHFHSLVSNYQWLRSKSGWIHIIWLDQDPYHEMGKWIWNRLR